MANSTNSDPQLKSLLSDHFFDIKSADVTGMTPDPATGDYLFNVTVRAGGKIPPKGPVKPGASIEPVSFDTQSMVNGASKTAMPTAAAPAASNGGALAGLTSDHLSAIVSGMVQGLFKSMGSGAQDASSSNGKIPQKGPLKPGAEIPAQVEVDNL